MSDRYSGDYLRDMQEAIRLGLEFTEGLTLFKFGRFVKWIN